MAHHGRWGERAVELILLVLLLFFSVAYIAGLVWLVLQLPENFAYLMVLPVFTPIITKNSVRMYGLVPINATLGAVWRGYLRYYRYDPKTLRPTSGKKEKTDDSDDH